MREEELLINRLRAYQDTDMYPFHMPGHKRLKGEPEALRGMAFPDPFLIDITEIDGFDNLHHPEGILKESMEWAAGVYGADKTFYLVNGSSSGILSAVCGCVERGGRLLMSRNCHKSVYNGVYLSQLTASYIYPQEIKGLGIQGGIRAEDVERLLKRYMDTQAVLIVSPTYDGIVSDIEAIARVVHRAGLPLIVDEAHGAHFRYSRYFPVSALELGADIVIQSVHKTLPSLTQTALLHMKYNRPDGGFYGNEEAVERYLHMVQSSSPSYVLMSSIENSIFRMEERSRATGGFQEYADVLKGMRKRLEGMKHLKLAEGLAGQGGVFDMDISKIVVSTREAGITGAELDDMLRRKYHLEMEMCGADYVTAITTVMDSHEGLKRLEEGLLAIDGEIGKQAEALESRRIKEGGEQPVSGQSVYSIVNDTAMTITEAMEGKKRAVKLDDSRGCISGEFVYVYPPGIPILAPGEWISRKVLAVIQDYKKKGLPVQGLLDESLERIQVVEKG